VHDDLIDRNFTAEQPNRKWLTDITEHPPPKASSTCARSRTASPTEPSRVRSFLIQEDEHMPKKIDAAVKERALRMLADHRQDYPSDTALAEAVAKKVGVGRETARRWLVQADVNAGARPGVTSDESAEMKRLKAENKKAGRGQCDPQGGHGFLRVNAIVGRAWWGFARFFAASASLMACRPLCGPGRATSSFRVGGLIGACRASGMR
jgi:transposase-like protein